MSRYDGLIIPRSYSEYINKTDAATLQQALQLPGVLSGAVAAGDNKAVKSSAVNNALTNYSSIKTYSDMVYNQKGYFRMKINQIYGRSLSFILFLGTHSILFTFYKSDGDMKISARDLGNNESGSLDVTFKFSTDNYLYFYKNSNSMPSYSIQAINIIGSYNGTVGVAETTTEELYNNAQKTITIVR